MGTYGAITWSSDGKAPYDECGAGIHVFHQDQGDETHNPEGITCQCGQTVWGFVTCDLCKEVRGRAVPIIKQQA